MRGLAYGIIKIWIRCALFCYYGKIRRVGVDNVPKNGAVLLLPNHQNALMDVLLLAVYCGRKPYFLTRSDVFAHPLLKRFFTYLQMLPIYRLRNGSTALQKNYAIFESCADLLKKDSAILLFPEANHDLRRRVRPLSKGYARIIHTAIGNTPDLKITIVPIGLNYRNGTHFPDRVSLYFGKPIAVNGDGDDAFLPENARKLTELLAARMKTITTHIDDTDSYEQIVSRLHGKGVDFLDPVSVNKVIANLDGPEEGTRPNRILKGAQLFLKPVFVLLNLPVVLVWWAFVKPRIWEPEFTATLRFAYGLFALPIYLIMLFFLVTIWAGALWALVIIGFLFLFDFGYVKLF